MPPSPPERTLREAFAQLMMESKSFLDGMDDPQCDTSPIAVSLYTRGEPGAHADDFEPKESEEADSNSRPHLSLHGS